MSDRNLVWALGGKCLFRMAVIASKVYMLKAEKQREIYREQGLVNEGSVRQLQHRLVRHVNRTDMASKQANNKEKTSPRKDLSLHATRFVPQEHFGGSHVFRCGK